MNRRLLALGLLPTFAALVGAADNAAPILPEVRRHLDDGWACLKRDPHTARDHAMVVLMGRELAVEVDLRSVPRERRTACRAAVDEALEAWQEALGGDPTLRRLPEGEHGPVAIRFQPDVREKGEPVAGYVDWERAMGRPVTGIVQVRTVGPDGEAMTGRAMRHVVLHEIGHLLGLDDADRDGEAMSPLDVARPISRPTVSEATAVRALRAEAERLLKSSL